MKRIRNEDNIKKTKALKISKGKEAVVRINIGEKEIE